MLSSYTNHIRRPIPESWSPATISVIEAERGVSRISAGRIVLTDTGLDNNIASSLPTTTTISQRIQTSEMTGITRQVLRTQHLAAFTTQPSIAARRPFSTSRASWEPRAESKPTTTNKPHTIDPRWLTLMKRRIGKCMMFGLKTPQVQEAGEILQQLARDWRELVAGSEGFLTNDTVRGLFRHNVAWGEMVCI